MAGGFGDFYHGEGTDFTLPVVSAGAEVNASAPGVHAIAGSVTVDTAHSVTLATTSWSVVSKPAGSTCTFANAAALSTTATTNTPGDYRLRLTGTDSRGGVGTGDTLIRVLAGDSPTVSAGANTSQPTAAQVTLTGTASAGTGRTLASTAWVLTETTPAGVVSNQSGLLANAAALTTTFTPAGLGYTYEAVLSATDDLGQVNRDARTITVEPLAAKPSGSIGDQQTINSLAAFNCVEAGAAGVTGATSYAWTAIQVADPDTSGAGPSGTFSDDAVQAPTFTPNWPCNIELTCTATGPGGSQTFRRAVKVNVAGPTSTITVSDQPNTAQVTCTGNAGTTHAWTLWTPTGSAAALSSASAQSPTFTPDLAGIYTLRHVVTDAYGRTATAVDTVEVGDVAGFLRVADVDLTAGSSQDVKAGGDGNYTVDGVQFSAANTGGTSAWTLGGGVGCQSTSNGVGAWHGLRCVLSSLVSSYNIEDDVVILYRRTTGATTTANQQVRLGLWGGAGIESGTLYRHGSGVAAMTNFAGWSTGSFTSVDPQWLAYRRRGNTHQYGYATSGGVPDIGGITWVGRGSFQQVATDANKTASTNTIDYFHEQSGTASVWTETITRVVALRRAA